MEPNLRHRANAVSTVQISPFLRQKAIALSAGIAILRKILKEHSFPNGFTTKQIYHISQNYPPPKNFPPYVLSQPTLKGALPVPRPEHPIRSIRLRALSTDHSVFANTRNRFLKTMILPSLEGQRELRTVMQPRSGLHPEPDLSNLRPMKRKQRNASNNEFVWHVIPPEERLERQPQPHQKEVIGTEVGVGIDVSHLNKRRQRSRVKKVTEAVIKLKGQKRFSKELEEVAHLKAN